jgi:hypothetical protein
LLGCLAWCWAALSAIFFCFVAAWLLVKQSSIDWLGFVAAWLLLGCLGYVWPVNQAKQPRIGEKPNIKGVQKKF